MCFVKKSFLKNGQEHDIKAQHKRLKSKHTSKK